MSSKHNLRIEDPFTNFTIVGMPMKYLKIITSYQSLVVPYSEEVIRSLRDAFICETNYSSNKVQEVDSPIRIEFISSKDIVRYADRDDVKKEKLKTHREKLLEELKGIDKELGNESNPQI